MSGDDLLLPEELIAELDLMRIEVVERGNHTYCRVRSAYIPAAAIRDFIGTCVSCKSIVRTCTACKGAPRLYPDTATFCCLRPMIDVVLKEVEKDAATLGDNSATYAVKDMARAIVDSWNRVQK
jgi:hypothetical protein